MKIAGLCAVTLVCILLSSSLYAADSADGGDWKSFGRYRDAHYIRNFFIQGIYEGVLVMNQARARDVYYSADYAMLASAVDEFYNDEDNTSIPITHALYIISMRMKGKPKDTVEDMLKKFRGGLRLEFLTKQ